MTDRDAWAKTVIESCCSPKLLAERWPWRSASDLREPGLALVADIHAVSDEVTGVFDNWATRAWQPLCVVSIEAVPNAGELASLLRAHAFDRIVPAHGAAVRALQSAVQDVLQCDAWIAVLAARAFSCTEPVVIRALAAGLALLPRHHTVRRWARVLGHGRRQELESVFSRHALPAPKTVLDHLRLARVVHAAATVRPAPSREALAERFGYSSGDYLGKRAKALTGVPLGQLAREGAPAVFRARLRL